jgi:hypothetical protein
VADDFTFDIRTRGDWDRVAKDLKAADKTIRVALGKGIRAQTKAIVDDQKRQILAWESTATRTGGGGARGRARAAAERSRSFTKGRASADRRLSRGGFGLRSTIAASIQTKISYSGVRTGVRIRVDNARLGRAARNLPERIDEGTWRHPVMGNRDVWVAQTGQRGWFTTTAERHAPQVVAGINREVTAALSKLD